MTSDNRRSASKPSEQLLDLLLDALQERQAARQRPKEPDAGPGAPADSPPTALPTDLRSAETSTSAMSPPAETASPVETAVEDRPAPEVQPSMNLGRTLGRFVIGVAVLAVLVNVPVNRYGTSLARILPDTASLVLRDGLVLKAAGPDIYVLEDSKLRWISSLEAFEYFGYRWDQVQVVEQSFLDRFEKGRPIHVVLKCQGSPHIYALENGQKRWIKDIVTFEAEGYVWEDVMTIDCARLRSLPDGPTIPLDAGTPPQP